MLYIAPLKLNDVSFLDEEFIIYIYMECLVISARMHAVHHASIKYSHHIVRIKVLHLKKIPIQFCQQTVLKVESTCRTGAGTR